MLVIISKDRCANSACKLRLRWSNGLVEKYCSACGQVVVQYPHTAINDDLIRDMDKQAPYQCPCGALAPHLSDRECRESDPVTQGPKRRRIVSP